MDTEQTKTAGSRRAKALWLVLLTGILILLSADRSSSALIRGVAVNSPVVVGNPITFIGACLGEQAELIVCDERSVCNNETPADEIICRGPGECMLPTTAEHIGAHLDIATCCDAEGCDAVTQFAKWEVYPLPEPDDGDEEALPAHGILPLLPDIRSLEIDRQTVRAGENITFTADCNGIVVCRPDVPCNLKTPASELFCTAAGNTCTYIITRQDAGQNTAIATCCTPEGCDQSTEQAMWDVFIPVPALSSLSNDGPVSWGEKITFFGECSGAQIMVCDDETSCGSETPGQDIICKGKGSNCSYLPAADDIGTHTAVATCCAEKECSKATISTEWTVLAPLSPAIEERELSAARERMSKKGAELNEAKRSRGKYSASIVFTTQKQKKGRVELVEFSELAELQELRTATPEDPPRIVRFSTDAVALNPLSVANATITLPKEGRVDRIMRCQDFDFAAGSCPDWEMTGIPFSDNGTHITFTVHSFSGYAGAAVTILNVQSYPAVGGNWEVQFVTEGTAPLTITAVDGTTWSLDGDNTDLQFLQVRCGSDVREYAWVNNSVFIPEYTCNATGFEVSKVLTLGRHVLRFTFGEEEAYAYNQANGYIKLFLSNAPVSAECGLENKQAVSAAAGTNKITWPGDFDSGLPGGADGGQFQPGLNDLGNTTNSRELSSPTTIGRAGAYKTGWLYDADLAGDQVSVRNITFNLTVMGGAMAATAAAERIAARISIVTCNNNNITFVKDLLQSQVIGGTLTASQAGWQTNNGSRVFHPAAGMLATLNNTYFYNGNTDPGTGRHTFRKGEKLFIELGFADGGSTTNRAIGLVQNNTNTFLWVNFTVNSSYDLQPPFFSFNRTNFTTIRTNELGLFNVTVTDQAISPAKRSNISTVILAFKNDTADWENITTYIFDAGVQNISIAFNMTISTAASGVQYWKYYANDTNDNVNESELYQIIITAGADNTPPVGSLNKTNFTSTSIRYNETGQFTINYTDNVALDTILFAVKNDSGDSFTNITTFRLGAGALSINITFNLSISSTNGETFQWRFWGNDTNSNINFTQIFSIVISDTIMSFAQNGTNFTSLRTGDNGMFNITAKDDDGLAMAIFSTRNTTSGVWFNFSAVKIGGTSYPIRYNYTSRADDGKAFQWKFYVNDTGGTINESNTFTVLLDDTKAPYYVFNRTNFTSIQQDQNGRFNITANDSTRNLDTIIFARSENGGAWANQTTQRINSTGPYDAAFNYTVTSAAGETFQWKFYINDSVGNMNESETFNLIVATGDSAAPYFAFNRTNFTDIRIYENGQFNITVTDAGSPLDTVIFAIKNDTAAWENRTAFRTTATSIDIGFNLTVFLAQGKIQYWKFYANDSNGFMNESELYQLIINDTRPATPSSFNVSQSHNRSFQASWSSADPDGDDITYHITAGTTVNGTDIFAERVQLTNKSNNFFNMTLNYSNDGLAQGWANETIYMALWATSASSTSINNYTPSFILFDKLPDVTDVLMSDNNNLAAYTNCTGSAACAFNPVSGSNITLAVNITTIDADNDCTSAAEYGKLTLFLCLNSTAKPGCGDVTNANFTFAVDTATRKGTSSSCEWTFATNLTNITPQFFVVNGSYLYYINATSQSGFRSLDRDNQTNGTWRYNALKAVTFPSSITLGDGDTQLGQWNDGNSTYNMTNYGNQVVFLRWNSTDFTRAGADKNWTLTGWDFLLDDDADHINDDSVTGKIPPLNLTNTTAEYFNHSTGLEVCVSKECNAVPLNDTLNTYWHIYPPLGLKSGTYSGVITYLVE
ncbi:hypothetical protein HY491_02220 [Candidatus Woesearchaeota archaeon]|nr:hypothetical protein [Candidatus Woesearchaeota archaeon]